jgi:hypothetical protein
VCGRQFGTKAKNCKVPSCRSLDRNAEICDALFGNCFESSIRAELRPKLLNEPIVLYSVLVRALGATDETAKTSSDPGESRRQIVGRAKLAAARPYSRCLTSSPAEEKRRRQIDRSARCGASGHVQFWLQLGGFASVRRTVAFPGSK